MRPRRLSEEPSPGSARHDITSRNSSAFLAVTALPVLDYWCYCPPHPPLRLEVRRDDTYIERLLAAEETFWKRFASAGLPHEV